MVKKKIFLNRTKDEWCKFLLDLLLFYTTAFFVLLGIFCIAAMIFLIPFFIDPAWSTLQADFDETGTECKTVVALERKGEKLNFRICIICLFNILTTLSKVMHYYS